MPDAPAPLPHPELQRLAEALRQQPALAERYAKATDLDSLARRLEQDGYAVPRAALEHAMGQSELSEAQLDQVQGGSLVYIWTIKFQQARADNPALNDMTLPQWIAQGQPR
ncbi:hypothetical protein [Pseudoroseomonas cervicalis]|uniref:hypothetical protein n=1 Tax=Teichococcus cervicalis TaxID=204525 RepID=UPI0022F1ADB1|nr:hypothetical protein [Pseudoroseomonas cervicalis]WBV42301.1 hypothetical protein PFY06_13800 [Pseudoroseomonas cervicalis]